MQPAKPQTTVSARVIEAVAEALYRVEWKGSRLQGSFKSETAQMREYWLESAKAAIAAYQAATKEIPE